jgi:transcriptional regulator with XRE-family HTH domain
VLNIDTEKIRENMVRAREAAGLTVSQLSRISGISITCIRNYEKGRSLPGAYNMIQIAYAIGLSLDDYILGVDSDARIGTCKDEGGPIEDQIGVEDLHEQTD